MHDGQNLFDALTAFAGEWEVDETLNNLAADGHKVPIVVGIDNGGTNRLGEYTPWVNTQYGGGDGEKYMQFIVETLKPYIDQHYRTLPDRDNTALMGSSLGGLISHFGALRYQDVFSKAGLISPSYWFSDSIWSFTHQTGKQDDMRFYQLCGDNEGAGVTEDMQRMSDSLLSIGFPQDKIYNKIIPGGQHNETLWRETFAEAYLWLFGSFANSVNEPFVRSQMIVYPNPVNNLLTLPDAGKKAYDTVVITDIKGRQVKSFSHPKNNEIDVSSFSAGSYIVKCRRGDVVWQAKFIKN
jgi:pimeloyl-ACP methyl ester carboxylesterase